MRFFYENFLSSKLYFKVKNYLMHIEKFFLNLSRGHLKLRVKVNFDVLRNFLQRTFHEARTRSRSK